MRNLKIYINILPILIVSMISILTTYRSEINNAKDDELKWINFMWISDSVDNQFVDKTRIYLPVRIEGIPHDFTLQFDLGSDITQIYDASIMPYLTVYPEVKQKLDTSNHLNHIDLIVDGYTFKDRSLSLREDNRNVLTTDSVDTKTTKHIGTIGVDLFKDKVLIIDYPNEQIAVTDKVPLDMAKKAYFVNITLDRRGRAVLPLQIKGKERKVLFDTGSSLFSILTIPENWAEVTSHQVTDSMAVPSWGETIYLYGTMGDHVYLGKQKLPKAVFYKTEALANFLEYNGTWGMTGNAYFWDNTVIVDFANKRFGVIK